MRDICLQAAENMTSDFHSKANKALDEWFLSVMKKFYPELSPEDAAKNFTLLIHPNSTYQLQLNGRVVAELRISYDYNHNENLLNGKMMIMVGV